MAQLHQEVAFEMDHHPNNEPLYSNSHRQRQVVFQVSILLKEKEKRGKEKKGILSRKKEKKRVNQLTYLYVHNSTTDPCFDTVQICTANGRGQHKCTKIVYQKRTHRQMNHTDQKTVQVPYE